MDDGLGSEVMSLTPTPSCQEQPIKMHAGKTGKGEHESSKLKAGEKSCKMEHERTCKKLQECLAFFSQEPVRSITCLNLAWGRERFKIQIEFFIGVIKMK